jgi:hypothetical protein
MAVYFFDSSALVKRHVNETGSSWVRSLTRIKAGHTLYIARITAVEITSAITRRQRGRYLSAAQAGAMLGHFRRHLTHRYAILEMAPALFGRCDALGTCTWFARLRCRATGGCTRSQPHLSNRETWPGYSGFCRPAP